MSLSRSPLSTRRRLSSDAAPEVADGGTGQRDRRTAALPRADADDRLALIERCAWSLVWLGILVSGAGLWGQWWSWPAMDVLAPVLVVVSLVGMVTCWWGAGPRSWLHQGLGVVSTLVAVGAPQVVLLHTRLYYRTDSAALDHVAARVLAHGHDPYTASLSSAARLLNPASDFWTYTLSGGHVANVSYPAGSFLVYAPAIALGFHHEVVDWMDLYAWLATALLLFFLLPRFLRWLALLIALTGAFTGMFAGGGTEAMLMPLAMVAVWRWDRYGRGREAGVASWIGPVALGLACSIKQTTWFLVPFLVVGIAIEARRSGRSPARTVGRYLVTGLAMFAAVNVPFIVASPVAWWHGVTTPLLDPLVADGQGLVSLALHGLTGGVDMAFLTYASALAYLGILIAFVTWYPQLKRLWIFVVPVAVLFSPRSFTGYFIDLFPLALVAAFSVEAVPRSRRTRTGGRLRASAVGFGAFSLATCVTAALAFTMPTPLALTVDHVATASGQLRLEEVTVTVANRTGSSVTPHFMVDVGARHPTGFWRTAGHRQVVVGPHRSVTVRLFPPSPTFFEPAGSDWVVDAYTASPRWLTTSNDLWHNYVRKVRGP